MLDCECETENYMYLSMFNIIRIPKLSILEMQNTVSETLEY